VNGYQKDSRRNDNMQEWSQKGRVYMKCVAEGFWAFALTNEEKRRVRRQYAYFVIIGGTRRNKVLTLDMPCAFSKG